MLISIQLTQSVMRKLLKNLKLYLTSIYDSMQSVYFLASFPIRPISTRRKEQTDRKIWGFAFKEVSSKAGAYCTACFLALTGSVPCAQWFRLLLEDASVGKLHCTISQAGIQSRRKGLWSFRHWIFSCHARFSSPVHLVQDLSLNWSCPPQVRLKMNDIKPSKFQFYFSRVLEAFLDAKKVKFFFC